VSTVSMGGDGADRAPAGLKPDSIWRKFNVHKVPPGKIVGAALASYLIVALAWLGGAQIWLAFGLALIPWVPIAFVEISWTYKHYGWFVIFFVMAIVQTIHYSEHCIEVIQVHIFNTPVSQSLAIFSKLNVEGVHFFGDTFLTIGTMALLWRFPRNPWLWVAAPFQVFHQSEHTFLFFEHVLWGYPAGGPGLFAYKPANAAMGTPQLNGALGSLLNRPDLHWIYNTLYTVPFVIALVYQLKSVYDEALDEAFPETPKSALVAAAKKLETFKYVPGETVVTPGDPAARLYIITEGEADVVDEIDGKEVVIGTLGHGKVFGEHGLATPGAVHDKTIVAKTDLTILAMDEDTFHHLEAASQVDPAKAAAATESAAPAATVKPAPAV
jgi:Cyclic nucleotide-binding domain